MMDERIDKFYEWLDPKAEKWKLLPNAPADVVNAFNDYTKEREEEMSYGFITD